MKEERKLSVQLTEAERNVRGRQAARLLRQYSALEEEKKRIVKELGDKLKEVRRNADIAAAAAETGTEERMVECRVEIRGAQKDVIRTDTHEVIESRILSDEELEDVDVNDSTSEPPKQTRVRAKKGEGAPLN